MNRGPGGGAQGAGAPGRVAEHEATAPRLAILAEGQFAPATAKTAIGILRYAPFPVVAVVDSTRAGKDAADCVGVGRGVPIVASVEEAAALGARALVIGTAAAGGRIPDSYRPALPWGLASWLGGWTGLRQLVLAGPALADTARRGGGGVRSVRQP